jgi:hypothetical protein
MTTNGIVGLCVSACARPLEALVARPGDPWIMFWNQFQKFDLLAVWSLDVYLLRGNEFPVHMQCCPWMMAAQPIAISGHQFWDGQPAPRPELAPPPERGNVAPIDAGDGASDDSVLGPAGAVGAGEAPQLPQSDSSSDSDSDLSCE